MLVLSAFFVGLLFGIGLILAGMANPAKIQGFLDLAGAWDPSLALVMVGAIAVAMIGFHFASGMSTSVFKGLMQIPSQASIDRRLILGSLAFGAGWGIGGFCPGPALVVLGSGDLKAVVFVLAMLAGMAIH